MTDALSGPVYRVKKDGAGVRSQVRTQLQLKVNHLLIGGFVSLPADKLA
jgi:hypothetical protein